MYTACVYILLCSDGTYYTGSTKNLDFRLAQHECGEGSKHTKKRLPVKLIYYEPFETVIQAFYREHQIKKWSKAKKDALINGQYNKLKSLSFSSSKRSYLKRRVDK